MNSAKKADNMPADILREKSSRIAAAFGGIMKKQFKLIAAGLLIAVLAFAACTADDGGMETAEPMQTNGAIPTAEGVFGMVTGAPTGGPADSTGMPELSSAPEAGGSAEPEPSNSPEPSGRGGSIEGFMSGKVVDSSEIPEIAAALGREFPDHTIQSVTEELFDGSEVYRITLQGDGELARTVYVFADGSILIPTEGD